MAVRPELVHLRPDDRNIPAGAHQLMAERASAVRTLEIPGASHVVGVSHPEETAQLILEAAGGVRDTANEPA